MGDRGSVADSGEAVRRDEENGYENDDADDHDDDIEVVEPAASSGPTEDMKMVLLVLKNMQEFQYKLEKEAACHRKVKKKSDRPKEQDLLKNMCGSLRGGPATGRDEFGTESDSD